MSPCLNLHRVRHPLRSNVRVIALFDTTQDSAELKKQLQTVLDAPIPDLLVEPLADRDWSNTWRDTFGAMPFGECSWVCPDRHPGGTG